MRLFYLFFLLLGVRGIKLTTHDPITPDLGAGAGTTNSDQELFFHDRDCNDGITLVREITDLICNYYHCAIPDFNPVVLADIVKPDCPTQVTQVACTPPSVPCNPEDWPEECRVPWGEWSECDATCGGGQQFRERNLPGPCTSCHRCNIEYRVCNTQKCGEDCVVGDWSEWSDCNVPCLPNTPIAAFEVRKRTIKQGISPGVLCNQNDWFETRPCQLAPPCAQNCEVGDWVKGECSVSCGCGTRTDTRPVTKQPSNGGAPCPYTTRTQSCHCHDCDQPCLWSDWSYGACSGDCYEKIGDTFFYPQRRKSRYVIQQAKGTATKCENSPCAAVTTDPCTSVPECTGTCKTSQWSDWHGNCPACIEEGQPVPFLYRTRSITEMGDGICGCLREEQICDTEWCPQDCIATEWSDWGPCIVDRSCQEGENTLGGKKYRQKGVIRPANSHGEPCKLEDEAPCSICCPRDCKVGGWDAKKTSKSSSICQKGHLDANGIWNPLIDAETGLPVPLLCGPEQGRIHYFRVNTPGNECGAPCPNENEKLVPCYAPWTCCPQDCEIDHEEYSECFGCGNNAIRFKKTIIKQHESCGGTPCCILEGTCSLFTVQPCEAPVPQCPQTPCIYSEYGEWEACSKSCTAAGDQPGSRCRYAYPVAGVDETCRKKADCVPCNTQCCPVDCVVGDWGLFGEWRPTCGLQVRERSRPITTQPICHGSPCPPTLEHDTRYKNCSVDCKVDEWSSWTVCPSCRPRGEDQQETSRHRAILIQPSDGGRNCPDELVQHHPCNAPPCDENCEVSDWTNWGPCSAECGDGFEERTREIRKPAFGQGVPCPILKETQYCYVNCPHCLVGPPEEDGECSHTCVPEGSGIQPKRRMRRRNTPVTYTDAEGVQHQLGFCPSDEATWLEDCFVPCCPRDCVMAEWGPWSECIDGVKSRQRHVISYPSCNGARCPECLLEKDVCDYTPPPGECEFGEACEEGWSSDEAVVAAV